ncbi:uncharacterized protein B0H64DRAFT_212004 [Chaetomium fimeti]|uniref:Uncharacterized protein n=1 Tax=Chaetomium fimeti TaxID=1854472 RepID=A0AAE0HBS7_9PEZI|nr:hypothetical protein B0H64DRAFT_212004 [Chaetomium fimeti]
MHRPSLHVRTDGYRRSIPSKAAHYPANGGLRTRIFGNQWSNLAAGCGGRSSHAFEPERAVNTEQPAHRAIDPNRSDGEWRRESLADPVRRGGRVCRPRPPPDVASVSGDPRRPPRARRHPGATLATAANVGSDQQRRSGGAFSIMATVWLARWLCCDTDHGQWAIEPGRMEVVHCPHRNMRGSELSAQKKITLHVWWIRLSPLMQRRPCPLQLSRCCRRPFARQLCRRRSFNFTVSHSPSVQELPGPALWASSDIAIVSISVDTLPGERECLFTCVRTEARRVR